MPLSPLRKVLHCQAWWHTPLILALGRQRQGISEFEASLVYKVSSRTARAIQRNPISKNKKILKKKKKRKEKFFMSWRDGSAVKSTDCSSRGPEFNSQQPHGGSQPSVMGSDALFWCVWRQRQCTHIHKINKLLKKKRKEKSHPCKAKFLLIYNLHLRLEMV